MLLAAFGHRNLHLALGPQRQRFGHQRAIGDGVGEQDQRRGGALVIELADKGLQNFAVRQIGGLARKIWLVAPVLSGAEEEHLNANIAALAINGEQIGLDERRGIDALRRLDLAHGAEPIAELCGAFEIEGFGRGFHLLHQLGLKVAAFAVEEAHGLKD